MKTAKKVMNGNKPTGAASEAAVLNPAIDFGYQARANRPLSLATIFNTMRILKAVNPGDTYLENYISMRARYGEDFFDTYQVLWAIGVHRAPKKILEIGTRTGISLCQLLSAHSNLKEIDQVVCVDPFDQWTSANLVRANLRYLNLPCDEHKIKIYAIKSDDYFNQVTGTFDYILVDGDHSKEQARKDLESAHARIDKQGIIVFDDISQAPGECALLDVWEAWVNAHSSDYYVNTCLSGKGVAWAIKK